MNCPIAGQMSGAPGRLLNVSEAAASQKKEERKERETRARNLKRGETETRDNVFIQACAPRWLVGIRQFCLTQREE
jgi:hypothetical protein